VKASSRPSTSRPRTRRPTTPTATATATVTTATITTPPQPPQPPRRRRLDALARRATILEAAAPAFTRSGYDQTRVADIAARIGVTEPVIFQHFGTKAELFAAVLDHVADGAVAHLTDLAAAHASVADWLRHLLAPEYLDHLHTAPMFGVLFEDAHRLSLEPGVSGALQRTIGRVAEALAGVLQRGQTEGSIRTDTPPLTLAWLVVSLVQARQFRRRFTPEPSRVLEGDLLDHVLEAVRPPRGHRRKTSSPGRHQESRTSAEQRS
jgi:AcrR family transcriptional regulator